MKTRTAKFSSSCSRLQGAAALIFLAALLSLIAGVIPFQSTVAAPAEPAKPISLDPQNPHYFLFRGRPTVLITSTEHYGALMNMDFYYPLYLSELQSHGFNLTRLFSGVYVEDSAAFHIARNTLAPAPLRFICPWARSTQPGYAGGGNKFDLHTWDPAYFHRLKDFVAQAGKRGIVVEMVLLCPYYHDQQWDLSPIKASNNIQGIGDLPRTKTLTLDNGPLLAIQDAMVRKIVTELRDFDNVYYEICNEPYFGGVTITWQNHIAETIKSTEAAFPAKHLIAQNISNGSKKIEDPNPPVSIFNFHYSRPPKSVAMNFGLNRVISDDETGFRGTADRSYRREGWDFILAGGAVYDNLDYSFTAGHEDGTFKFPPTQLGGGGHTLQAQLSILKKFIESFDFVHMHPDASDIKAVGNAARIYALAQPGKVYAVYVDGGGPGTTLLCNVPAGRYHAEWINTLTGAVDKTRDVSHDGGTLALASPPYSEDVALRLVRE
jgi:Cellulase (glycosyl hydrolase family 5)